MGQERRRLIERASSAKNRDQVTAAQAAMIEWLVDYPDDLGVKNKLKDLSVTEAWLKINKEWW